jgi:hypothetical protein
LAAASDACPSTPSEFDVVCSVIDKSKPDFWPEQNVGCSWQAGELKASNMYEMTIRLSKQYQPLLEETLSVVTAEKGQAPTPLCSIAEGEGIVLS